MTRQTAYQSCSMSIESGTLCQYCSNDAGELISFAECLERFVQWTLRQEPGTGRQAAERKALEFMAGGPTWRDNPELLRRLTVGG